MIKYHFPQFQTEVVNPIIIIRSVIDHIESKMCSVNVVLETSCSKVGIQLNGFKYDVTWNDVDIELFVKTELKKYLIQ